MFVQQTLPLDRNSILMDRNLDVRDADGHEASLNIWVSPSDSEDTVIEVKTADEFVLLSLDFTALHKLLIACQDALGIQDRLITEAPDDDE